MSRIKATILSSLAAILLISTSADAKPRHHRHHHYHTYHSDRPAGCPHLWCGCYLRKLVGIADESLNVALNWMRVGTPASHGCTNCVAVMKRRGGGHVGMVKGYDSSGNPIILSGNHGGRIAVAVYPARRIIAYRNI